VPLFINDTYTRTEAAANAAATAVATEAFATTPDETAAAFGVVHAAAVCKPVTAVLVSVLPVAHLTHLTRASPAAASAQSHALVVTASVAELVTMAPHKAVVVAAPQLVLSPATVVAGEAAAPFSVHEPTWPADW